MEPPLSCDPDIRDLVGQAIHFRCLACGQTSDRPTGYLVRTYGVATVGDVRRRARCLRYIGSRRCGGPADVTLVEHLIAPLPGGSNARRVGDGASS